jgi:hypothetical protein
MLMMISRHGTIQNNTARMRYNAERTQEGERLEKPRLHGQEKCRAGRKVCRGNAADEQFKRPSAMAATVKLEYPAIVETIKPVIVSGRTESHAFLVWYLQHYFRLDETESQDTVCDGPDDKGVDGVYVDENLETVFVFQCKLVQNPRRTLGDTQLKEFVGTLAQFRDPAKIADIAATTANKELASLLTAGNVAQFVTDGFAVKGVFVTNIDGDANAQSYLKRKDDIRLFDKVALEASFISAGPTEPVGTPVTFDVFGYDCAQYQIGEVNVILAPLKGNELIKLDGIASCELFCLECARIARADESQQGYWP